MNTIHLFDETISIAFNMAVEIGYEEITGEIFDIESIRKTKNMVALLYAAVVVNNPGTKITIDDLYTKAKASDITALRDCVFQAMNEWIAVPAVMEENAEESGDAKKN